VASDEKLGLQALSVFARLDPAQPWFDGFRQGLQAPGVRMVDASLLPPGEAYEAFIARTQQVPTRANNLHDALNALVWQRHPRLKARLNALQAAEIARDGVTDRRGPTRDALTLFDENGLWWPRAPAPLAQALRRRDWHTLFVTHRALWQGVLVHPLGHALLEKLATAPRKALTAHVLLHDDPIRLTREDWATKPFHPLPVLGIPGWQAANEDPAYYQDTAVFRPGLVQG
jgi:hypothetical protein